MISAGKKRLSLQGTVPLRNSQRGYLLVTVIITLFLLASIAVLLSQDSAISANTSNKELESARADYVAAAGLQNALWRLQNNACMGDITIPDTVLGNDAYSATITGAAAGTVYELAADQDAWIRNDMPTVNNGNTAANHIRQETGNVEHTLTRFDLTALPAKGQILSAVAWFNLKATKEHPEGPISAHEITADWSETSVTWESFAGAYRSAVVGMIPAQDTGNVWVGITITGLVQAWVNGQPNYGILMQSSAEGVHGEYLAREDGTNPPRLEVVVGSGPASPVTIKAKGELDNGISRTLKDKLTAAYQPPGTVTLQLGADSGADAMLDSFYPRNYGGRDFVQVNENTGDWVQRPVFRFDLGRIPAQAAVVSAQLELRLKAIKTPGTITVHRVSRSWVEGTKSGTGTADGATWATYDGINNWTTTGGDFDAAAVSEAAIDGGETWVTWEVGSLVEEWLAGEPNYGLLIKSDGILEEAEFYSKEQADGTLRPKLTITYACECGTPCMAPQGSGNILMVVVSPTVLVDEDQQAKDLFESWGYTVSVISESANQSSYDSAVAANDVVFISETVNSNSVGTRLVNAKIGVVSQDGDYNPDLGFATGSTLKVGTDIDVTTTDHYITRPFRVGPLPIYAAGMEQLVTTGALTAGQQTLAELGGDASLVVLDQGAAMEGGGSAAGRRVVLPLGTRYRFDWDRLNANGRLLVHRALAWAMGAGKTNAGKLLLVVADATSPLTSETDRKSLIESWGYEVVLISDHALQAEFDTALADVDVAYIAGSGSSTAVGTKLTGATVGVLSEDIGLVDELGIAQPSFLKRNSQSIDIFDNTHYVTSGFSLGTLQLYSYLPGIWTVTGLYAPGLQVLAGTEASGSSFPPGLAFLEAGAELWGGGSAAGRRVQVPWSEGSFDINSLNADGQTIFRRAIEWGAGAAVLVNDGWAVGDNGAVYRTADAGASWTAQASGTTQSLYSVVFPTPTIGYAAGTGEILLKTIDGGNTWNTLSTGTNSLWALDFLDADTGYTVGIGATVKMTTDGGSNWANQDPATTQNLRHIDFVDASTGYLAGLGGVIRKTTNGGTSWSIQNSGVTTALYSIDFADTSTGWAVGDAGVIVKTTDGGASWNPQVSGTSNKLQSVAAIDSTTAVAVGRVGLILKTTDGGSSWDTQASGTTGDLWYVHFVDATTGYVTGQNGEILKTTDGGTTWTSTDLGTSMTMRAIYFADAGGAGPTTGPIAHWKLDDGTGTTAIDSEGGHDGTLANGPVWVAGYLGDALSFDGSNDRINVPHDSGLNLVSQMTLSAWIYADTLGPFQMVLTKGDNGTDENYWLGTETNRVNFGFVDGGTYAQHTTSGLEIGTGSWHHIAATFDDAANEVKIYVDGVAETFTNTYTPAPNSERLIIGNSYYGEGFDGVIDDVRLYDRVLSDTEIAELASAGGSQQEILLVVADATNLSAQDIARQTLMTDWGYQVATISASDSQANFDAAVATANAAYVVMQNSSTALGTKLRDATIAVINEEVELRQDIGFSANRDWPTTRDNVDIIVDGHYITSPFTTGLLTIATVPIEVVTLSGQMAGGLLVLGQQDWGGLQNSLSVIDTGGALYGGGNAAGRRVQLPWGRVGFDINDLNADGLTIMRRAIEWGLAGGGGGGGGSGGGPGPVFEEFTDASASSNVTSLNVTKPGGTVAGDLLIAALATDDDSATSFNPPSGWTPVNVGMSSDGKVSFGVWWKIATGSEPSQYSFTWSGSEEAYGWVSRFTGHDPGSPIYYDAGALNNTNTTAPICQRLNTPVDNMLVLRLGGFDDDDITIGNPGLDGHTAINMNKSGAGSGTVSGGSGYLIQATAGDSGLGYFQLTRAEQMRTVTLGIRPAP